MRLKWSSTGAASSKQRERSRARRPRRRRGGGDDGGGGRFDRRRADRYPFFFSNSRMNSTSAATPSSGKALYSDARMPPTERCPFSPSRPDAVASLSNFFSSSSLGSRNVTFINERLSFCAVPR